MITLTERLMAHPILCPMQVRAQNARHIGNDVIAENVRVERLEREFYALGVLINRAADKLPVGKRDALLERLWPYVLRAEHLLMSAREDQARARRNADVWAKIGRSA